MEYKMPGYRRDGNITEKRRLDKELYEQGLGPPPADEVEIIRLSERKRIASLVRNLPTMNYSVEQIANWIEKL